MNDDDKIVWAKVGNGDDFKKVEKDGRIDLSDETGYVSNYGTVELIVGSAKQLDRKNKRYQIGIETTGDDWKKLFDFEVSSEENNVSKSDLKTAYVHGYQTETGEIQDRLELTVDERKITSKDSVNLKMKPESDKFEGTTIKFFEGFLSSANDLKKAKEITRLPDWIPHPDIR